VRSDGTARVSGFVVGADGQRLVARPNEPAHATCADVDRNGTAGLTELAVPVFRPGPTREPVFLARIVPDGEIDEPGTYHLVVTTTAADGRTETVVAGDAVVWIGDVNGDGAPR
jgi:hypothetical protein